MREKVIDEIKERSTRISILSWALSLRYSAETYSCVSPHAECEIFAKSSRRNLRLTWRTVPQLRDTRATHTYGGPRHNAHVITISNVCRSAKKSSQEESYRILNYRFPYSLSACDYRKRFEPKWFWNESTSLVGVTGDSIFTWKV